MRSPLRYVATVACAALLLAACGAEEDAAQEAATDQPAEENAAEDPDDPDEADDGDDGDDGDDDAEAASGGDLSDEPAVSLNFGHGFAPTHEISAELIEPFIEQVADITGGTVDIELHPGGALGDGPSTYDNVVVGAQDVGWTLQGYTPGRFPITELLELPFQFFGASEDEPTVAITDALWDLYEEFPEFQAEYEDVKVLALWAHEPGYLWTNDREVASQDDLSGLTLRAPGPRSNELIGELGASPVSMPAGEIYDSLERGVIDGLMIAPNGIRNFDLGDVISYGVACDCYTSPYVIAMNLEAWEQLSPAQQEAIDQIAGRELSLEAARVNDGSLQDAWDYIDGSGIEIVSLSDDELQSWTDAAEPVVDDWIADAEAAGAPGQEMYDRLQEIVSAW